MQLYNIQHTYIVIVFFLTPSLAVSGEGRIRRTSNGCKRYSKGIGRTPKNMFQENTEQQKDDMFTFMPHMNPKRIRPAMPLTSSLFSARRRWRINSGSFDRAPLNHRSIRGRRAWGGEEGAIGVSPARRLDEARFLFCGGCRE